MESMEDYDCPERICTVITVDNTENVRNAFQKDRALGVKTTRKLVQEEHFQRSLMEELKMTNMRQNGSESGVKLTKRISHGNNFDVLQRVEGESRFVEFDK